MDFFHLHEINDRYHSSNRGPEQQQTQQSTQGQQNQQQQKQNTEEDFRAYSQMQLTAERSFRLCGCSTSGPVRKCCEF